MLTLIAWISLYLAVIVATPSKNVHRGFIWRALKKVPPWRWHRGEGPGDQLGRAMWLLMIWWTICWVPPTSLKVQTAMFYGGIIVTWLDDYLNGGDDDLWKKFVRAKNKIRWRLFKPSPINNL